MKIALINNRIVDNIIAADLEFAEQLGYEQVVDVTDISCSIGWLYDGTTFTEPKQPEVEPIKNPILTPYEFLKRFTSEERKAIKAATLTNPDVDDLWTMFTVAQNIDIRNTDTIDGVNALESAGILAIGRAAKILML